MNFFVGFGAKVNKCECRSADDAVRCAPEGCTVLFETPEYYVVGADYMTSGDVFPAAYLMRAAATLRARLGDAGYGGGSAADNDWFCAICRALP